MSDDVSYAFGPFRLDLGAGALCRGREEVALTPKAFQLLAYLVEQPGRLIPRDELLEAVWPATFVGDQVLKVRIRELRRALDDRVETARFISTVHRRGYRFVAEVRREAGRGRSAAPEPGAAAATAPKTSGFVGRAGELERLAASLVRARGGERRTVFVSGDPGIGKTTLVEEFVDLASEQGLCVARGQCLQLHGAGESYLPWLDALGRLAAGRAGPHLVAALRARAPAWLAQMPWLLEPGERAGVEREAAGGTQQRMLRELAETVEAFTAETPCIILLEDLHWSDASTLDLLSFLARRREPARLLLIATYRPEEVAGGEHPLALLAPDLSQRGFALELPLGPLDEAETERFVAARLDGEVPAGLARLLHRLTEGSPLYLASALEDLLTRGLVARTGDGWRAPADPSRLELAVPPGLRALLEQQLERLEPADRRALEAASVCPTAFAARALAEVLSVGEDEIEDRCASLARRRRFLRAVAAPEPAPGESVYDFVHAIHRALVYDRVPAGRRARLHGRFAERAEREAGAGAAEHAAELAFHFERAGRPGRALPYLVQAGRNAARRLASHETLMHADRALALLAAAPATAEPRLELELQVMRGTALMSTRGYGDADAERALARARELCDPGDRGRETFRALAGLFGYRLVRADLAAAGELAQTLLARDERSADLRAEAAWCAGLVAVNLGDFTEAHRHLEEGIAAGTAADPEAARAVFGRDVVAACLSFDGWALWSLGAPQQALERTAEAERRARSLADAQALSFALFFTAFVHHLRREPDATLRHCDELIALSRAEGFAQWHAFGRILRGWALGEGDGAGDGSAEVRAGLAAYRATGAAISVPHFLGLLAEGLAREGDVAEAERVVAEALEEAVATGGRYYEAELLRLRGELVLAGAARPAAGRAAAEPFFRTAVETAERQRSPAFALRAAASWLRASPGSEEARRRLRKACASFTEGFDTPDLRDAAVLLER